MALNFLNRTRRATVPNTGGVQTAVGGVADPVAQAAQNVATPATTPPPNAAVDLAGGVAGGTAPAPAAATPRTHSNYPNLLALLGQPRITGIGQNINDLLARRLMGSGPVGLS